ncbi:hypothetical protein, partial [Streptomyces sp. IB2014 016-6]|uniref:hypothetical protein n=1 Tax=Streptomyces sp. IB2014 016-6 TaxID=2517818 RepID=UPI0011CC73A5
MAMTDAVLADEIRKHVFQQDMNGRTVLPPGTIELGRRLDNAIIRGGKVNSGLREDAQQALEAKGFTLVEVHPGRWGLPADTPRAGGTPRAPMTDAELAGRIEEYDFQRDENGRIVLPPARTELGKRLQNAIIRGGKVNSGLREQAMQALRGKGCTLVDVGRGRWGLAADTPRAGAAVGAGAGAERPVRAASAVYEDYVAYGLLPESRPERLRVVVSAEAANVTGEVVVVQLGASKGAAGSPGPGVPPLLVDPSLDPDDANVRFQMMRAAERNQDIFARAVERHEAMVQALTANEFGDDTAPTHREMYAHIDIADLGIDDIDFESADFEI